MANIPMRLVVWALVAGLCGAVQAQQQPLQPAKPPSAEAQAAAQSADVLQSIVSPSTLLALGAQAGKGIDDGRLRELWANASPTVRAELPDDDFVKGVTKMRAGLGAPARRIWIGLNVQQRRTAEKLPPALFGTVTFETQFTQPAALRREIISFRQDDDKQWRFAGYVMQ